MSAVSVCFDLSSVPRSAQLVFITEYMTSGSLLQFLKKAKRTKKRVTERVRVVPLIPNSWGSDLVLTIII